ncbi:MAG: hypothetical protein J5943_10390 [Oribacterium sp.]|nr:hypothetical protein [Oribacterium sp.]MBO6310525.1 hypothetical protein [Oribacterium sp.]MBP3803308.1 hypothetical protein [Oribacterium sp.]MCR5007851.1 hypothetical protein [Oribacterium sp.]
MDPRDKEMLPFNEENPDNNDDTYKDFQDSLNEFQKEPSNAEIMAKLEQNHKLMVTTLVITLLAVAVFVILGFYLYNIVIDYKAEVDAAIETMKKVDSMVEQLEADYSNYSQKIDDFFDSVETLKSYLDSINSALSSIPSLRLPF